MRQNLASIWSADTAEHKAALETIPLQRDAATQATPRDLSVPKRPAGQAPRRQTSPPAYLARLHAKAPNTLHSHDTRAGIATAKHKQGTFKAREGHEPTKAPDAPLCDRPIRLTQTQHKPIPTVTGSVGTHTRSSRRSKCTTRRPP